MAFPQGLNRQLGQVRRLAQPYFLPLEAGAWPFAVLLLALIALVSGLTLLLLSAVAGLAAQLLPDSLQPLLRSARHALGLFWRQPLLPPLLPGLLLPLGLLPAAMGGGSRGRSCRAGLAVLLLPWLALLLLPALQGLHGGPLGLTLPPLPPWLPALRSFCLQPLWPPAPALLALAGAGAACFLAWRRQLRHGRWLPWLLLGLVLLLILLINSINVGISYLARDVDNALVAYRRGEFWLLVAIYGGCLLAALPIRALQSYLIPRFGLLWRRWLTGRLLAHYLSRRIFYRLSADGERPGGIDNPDQRLSEDAASFTGFSLGFVVDVLTALLTFGSFFLVLWSISSSLSLWLLAYGAIGTGLVLIASRRLVVLNGEQLRLNADFRYGLVHIRDNAEAIAFYRGERQESAEALRRLDLAIRNQDRLIRWETLLTVIQTSYDSFSEFLPWLVLAPLYFARQLDFGVFGQAGIAFWQVLASISYIVNNIDRLAAFSASISRLEGFQAGMRDSAAPALPAEPASPVPLSFSASASPASILLRHVDLVPPGSERRLLHDLSLEVSARQRLLVVGPSGCGKTSFLRLVSGLWPAARGEVSSPEPGELLFIPQKPYMLLGS
ncbi:MAG: SbmA/BacA-like family transporter, partial [Synechococcaceae cyanobacterium]|nr:SbmA/BacA-like family transporter [Synechococcaceae cyanobacterium]